MWKALAPRGTPKDSLYVSCEKHTLPLLFWSEISPTDAHVKK